MELADFPPFYTIQPVAETQEKQLELWRDIILRNVSETSQVIDMTNYPAFTNSRIHRSLDSEGRQIVGDSLVKSGFGEWEDPGTKTRLRVFSKTPHAWAAILYEWARTTTRVGGDICSFQELQDDDDVEGTELQGVHEDLLLKAVRVLEEQGRAAVYPRPGTNELFVKFLEPK